MPTYEYACPRGHRFERFVRKISDAEAAPACPECGEIAVRQISGGGGLLFKGSGFYITDYGKDGKKSLADPAAKSESGKGESGTSESSKPAADPKPTGKSESAPSSKPKGGE
jgi:putative FmdB family regulatory protein